MIAILIFMIGLAFASIQAYSGDATYYALGLTACGKVFSDNDLVAATAFSHWTTANPNVDPNCGKKVRVTDPSTQKSVIVQIQDKCGACKEGDIDLSPSAFSQLRELPVGRFHVTWEYV